VRRARPVNDFATDLALLGLECPRLKPRDHAHAIELLDEWKAEVLKPAFKAAARATHPDLGGDEEDFKAVRAAYERAGAVKVRPPRQHRPVHTVRRVVLSPDMAELMELLRGRPFDNSGVRMGRPVPGGFSSFGTSTSSTTTGFTGGFATGWTPSDSESEG